MKAILTGSAARQALERLNWLIVQSSAKLGHMSQPLTADDLLPLIAKLSPAERRRLFRLIQKVGSDIDAYRATPPEPSEFSGGEDMLAWDADGWENLK